jgi:hypothetical protein
MDSISQIARHVVLCSLMLPHIFFPVHTMVDGDSAAIKFNGAVRKQKMSPLPLLEQSNHSCPRTH